MAFPVSDEGATSVEEQQLRSFQDLILRTFDPDPQLSMPISTTVYQDSGTAVVQRSTGMAQGVARLVITEQPMKETRYRYKSESGSHGPLIGESSTTQRKTYPAVRLENYNAEIPHRIRASLCQAEEWDKPHVHRITMKGRDEEDCCYVTVREDGRATFPSMSIVFQQKKTVADILFRRKVDCLGGQPSPEDSRRLMNDAKKEASEMNLNLVRILFTAEYCEEGLWKPLCCAYSNPVANSKAGKLKITKVNRKSGSCRGKDEVWILCEKINKKDIKIRFFEVDEETQQTTWEAYAEFAESDVHYQVAIIFKTPSYRDVDLQHDVHVKFQLVRKSDAEYSEPVDFIYKPYVPTAEEEVLAHKRRKLSVHSPSQPSSSPTGMPGMLGGMGLPSYVSPSEHVGEQSFQTGNPEGKFAYSSTEFHCADRKSVV